MILKGIFKVPAHKRFAFKPRYYDPIKEEITERTKRIETELQEEDPTKPHSSTIRGAFKRKTGSKKTFGKDYSAAVGQLSATAMLVTLCLGYWYFGNKIIYAIGAIVGIYILFRLRKK
ncbi:MAG: hypothetical protein QM536_08400 [Chitinophagaceae bacterium]|nr:hypothetical protein [Chitinophagaceae bacterium]